jgi:hypothetical protein
MHIGYQLSNILESVAPQEENNVETLYLCHNSVFDLFLTYCDIDPSNYDANNKKFLDGNLRISSWPTNDLIKSYGIHIVNNPLAYLKNNNSIHFHLNTVVFSHDVSLLSIKKEDAFLLCTNAFKSNDVLVYFNSIISNYNCPKINRIKLDYSIPDSIKDLNQDRNGTAIFCYNKTIGPELINNIDPNASQLISLPNSLEELNTILNKYEVFIELDPGSIINALVGIASGGVSIILDPNNSLSEYKNIPNLYIVNSLPEVTKVLSEKPKYNPETTLFNSKFRNFEGFKEKISEIIKVSQRKAFVL